MIVHQAFISDLTNQQVVNTTVIIYTTCTSDLTKQQVVKSVRMNKNKADVSNIKCQKNTSVIIHKASTSDLPNQLKSFEQFRNNS